MDDVEPNWEFDKIICSRNATKTEKSAHSFSNIFSHIFIPKILRSVKKTLSKVLRSVKTLSMKK